MNTRANLYEYSPALNQGEVEELLRVSEHGVRQLRKEGRLTPVKIGSRLVYPRWQLFDLFGLDDPDVAVTRAAAKAAEQVVVNAETAPVLSSDVPASHDRVGSLETRQREVTRAQR